MSMTIMLLLHHAKTEMLFINDAKKRVLLTHLRKWQVMCVANSSCKWQIILLNKCIMSITYIVVFAPCSNRKCCSWMLPKTEIVANASCKWKEMLLIHHVDGRLCCQCIMSITYIVAVACLNRECCSIKHITDLMYKYWSEVYKTVW